MKHRRTSQFKKLFGDLPPDVKQQAKKAFKLFQEDMKHPSLAIERIRGYQGVWSGRISRKYRLTFHFEEDPETGERICVHRVIGNHEEVYQDP